MSRTIDPSNMSDEDRAYLAQREGIRRYDQVRIETPPPVNTGQVNTQLAEVNAKGPRVLAPLGDLTSVAAADPEAVFSEDQTDIAHDDPSRTTVQAADDAGDPEEYPVRITLEETPVNMAETSETAPVLPAEDVSDAEAAQEEEGVASVGSDNPSDNYESLTNEELRDIIRDRKAKGEDLAVGGDKDDLVGRLRASDAAKRQK